MEPEDDLEGGVSELLSGVRVPLSASSLCGRLDDLVSNSDAVVLLGSVSGKWWQTVSERGGKNKDCLGFKVSKEGGEVK